MFNILISLISLHDPIQEINLKFNSYVNGRAILKSLACELDTIEQQEEKLSVLRFLIENHGAFPLLREKEFKTKLQGFYASYVFFLNEQNKTVDSSSTELALSEISQIFALPADGGPSLKDKATLLTIQFVLLAQQENYHTIAQLWDSNIFSASSPYPFAQDQRLRIFESAILAASACPGRPILTDISNLFPQIHFDDSSFKAFLDLLERISENLLQHFPSTPHAAERLATIYTWATELGQRLAKPEEAGCLRLLVLSAKIWNSIFLKNSQLEILLREFMALPEPDQELDTSRHVTAAAFAYLRTQIHDLTRDFQTK